MKILEARFKTSKSRKEYEELAQHGAHTWAEIPSLRWKIYGFNEEESMAIGIYLFDDVQVMNSQMTYLREALIKTEHVSELEMKVWDVQEDLSKITRAPI